jgi:DNA-binding CsgD family transcriptional regulator
MEALSRRDFRIAFDFVAMLGEASALDDFAARLGFGLHNVIPCDVGSYNEVNEPRQRVRWITNLVTGPEDVQAFERNMRDNPLLMHFVRRPLADAIRMSDLVSLPDLRNLGVYQELYHPHRLEQILAMEISTGPVSAALVAFRDGRDFSERDRAMMTMLRPHLANMYRNIETLTDLGDRLALLNRGFDIGGLGAIVLREDGGVRTMTDVAKAWLVAYFGTAGSRDRLPSPVEDWIKRVDYPSSTVDAMPAANGPLVIDRGETRLTLRLVRHGARQLVLMQEQRKILRATDLASLGLATREAEILAWVALGKTDVEIGVVLGISPRTVSHTLERVYRKLGVETRMAAARLAFEAHAKS